MRASNIRVVDTAEIPTAPSRPQKALNLILSTFAGLIAGIGLAFLQVYLDNTVKSPEDVARIAGIPTLAVVPKLSSVIGKHCYKYVHGHRYSPQPGAQLAGHPQSVNISTGAG